MKSHCINGHPYNDDNRHWRKDGSYACRRCNRERQRGVLYRGGAQERILDLLMIDGDWLTQAGIAHALGLSEATIHKSLYRLRKTGLLEERIVEMSSSLNVHRQVEKRREWRHVQAREAWAI